ncbi:leydig cell tumor 10 kDa protein homolog [Acanthaster planci]|uniref:Leydig cell tumor 10 kDa protein homolog n=1 Tax=Acanthaster planci TaxID=133434 RepID=A0A8B7ZG02_ACAPL|nr:leydig cell tumor 10 kDa protein homolog [Acanthaster planci]XP_022102171.1 leydig cell tumor 10 kDa protein homolog [Acanthaster planci]
MPQGKKKMKIQVLGRKSAKHSHMKKKATAVKKGRYIAPKKAKEVKMSKLKKNLQKAIDSNNEKEVVAMAAAREPRPMKVLNLPSPDLGGKKSTKKK